MEKYTAFARVYDEFMDDIDYDAWTKRIVKLLKEYGIGGGLVLDLGCGTGELTERLSKAGYDMTGVDASEEMLQKAIEKRDASGSDILYLCQDMREFELYGTMAAIVCTCDCVNYITEKDELLRVFKLVNNYLDPGGVFIFDFNTTAKYEAIGCDSISDTRDDAAFIWENYYDSESRLNEYRLTLFEKRPDGLYERSEEYHVQRAYALEEIRALLKESGLEFLAAFDGYSENEAASDSQRIVVVAREHGK